MSRPITRVEKKCEQCGETFSVKRSHVSQKFCKRGCQSAFETAHGRLASRKTPIGFTCRQCGAGFTMMQSYVTAYRKKSGKDPMYCSRKCAGLGKRLSEDQWTTTCIQCGRRMPIKRRPGGTVNRQRRLCSSECRSIFRRVSYRENNPDQEVTKRVGRHGYIRLLIPGAGTEPSRDILEHRYVMEQHLGRRLLSTETVHHIDGNRQRNVIENLELFSSRHGPGQRVIDKVAFAIEILTIYPQFGLDQGFRLVKASEHD